MCLIDSGSQEPATHEFRGFLNIYLTLLATIRYWGAGLHFPYHYVRSMTPMGVVPLCRNLYRISRPLHSFEVY